MPNLVGFVVLTLLPIVASLLLAFTDWQMLSADPPRWIGLDNFINLLGFERVGDTWRARDPQFWLYLYNTLFLMLGIPLCMAASLLLAVALNRAIRGIALLRAIFFTPSLCMGVAIFMVWRVLYHADFGLINQVLGWVGIYGPD